MEGSSSPSSNECIEENLNNKLCLQDDDLKRKIWPSATALGPVSCLTSLSSVNIFIPLLFWSDQSARLRLVVGILILFKNRKGSRTWRTGHK